MAASDSVADFLTVLRNAQGAHLDKVTALTSNLTLKICEILKEEGFIDSFKVITEGAKRSVRVHLKYIGKRPAIQGIRRISKPGLRRYVGCGQIPRVQGGLGVAIVSTSKGVLSDKQARKQSAGGELLCTVW